MIASNREITTWTPEIQRTLSFLRRGDATTDLDQACNVLTKKQVRIVFDSTSDQSAEAVAQMLLGNGFQNIEAIPICDLGSISIVDDVLLISMFTGANSSVAGHDHYAALRASKIMWLRTTLNVELGVGEIGPIFHPDGSLCLSCLTRSLARPSNVTNIHNASVCAIWPTLLASEVTMQLFRRSRSNIRSYRRYRLPLYSNEIRTWPASASCIPCTYSNLETSSSRVNVLPFLFEEAIASRQQAADSIIAEREEGKPSLPKKWY